MDTSRGSDAKHGDFPEQLLDVFKAAALSVTKLYRISSAAETRARGEGYQDCLDDLLSLLEKEGIGLGDGEGWRIRQWATEKLDGRDTSPQANDSEDESDSLHKPEASSNLPENHRAGAGTTIRPDAPIRSESAPAVSIAVEPQPQHQQPQQHQQHQQYQPHQQQQQPHHQQMQSQPQTQFTVPSQDTFTFQSPHTYPNIATLDLSDSRNHESMMSPPLPSAIMPPSTQSRLRQRHAGNSPRRSLGKGAGTKRKLNFAEIFDLGSLGGKDVFGNGGGKRSRHA